MNEDNLYNFIIEEEHAGIRIDSVLSSLMEETSRSYIQKLIDGGNVSVDGCVCLSRKEKLKAGAAVSVLLPPPIPCEARPEPMALDIVYEDEDLIVVNKPKGLVVHPGAGNLSGTLVNGLLHHCEGLSSINGVERPGIVHRIDKDTSGLLVCAKSDLAHRGLSQQLAEHSVTRRYRAIVCGRFKRTDGTVDAPVGRDPKNRLRMGVTDNGKHAVTHYHVDEELGKFSLITARLETGRTHQIRVHMSYIGHPLLGDIVYGSSRQPFGLASQMLHAQILGFIHPRTGSYMEFFAPFPEEFTVVLEKVRNNN